MPKMQCFCWRTSGPAPSACLMQENGVLPLWAPGPSCPCQCGPGWEAGDLWTCLVLLGSIRSRPGQPGGTARWSWGSVQVSPDAGTDSDQDEAMLT